MKNSELISYIESNYDVNSIKFKNLSVWLELRNRVYPSINLGLESTLQITKDTYLIMLKSFFYGFFNWFKVYNAWVLSSQVNRILIDDLYYDKIFDYPASKINKTLFIELSTDKHYSRSKMASKYIVSRSVFIVAEKTLAIFINVKKTNLKVYNQIIKDFNLKLSPKYGLKKMASQYLFMKFLLFFKKPKIVFVSPSYTCYGYIKAFKEKGIKVVEIQHGVIIKEHFGYNLKAKFDEEYFADNLLTFGHNEMKVFGEGNNAIEPKKVHAIGNYYLDYIIENYKPSTLINELKINFNKSIVVSLQEIDVTLRIIPEIIIAAKKQTDCLFILKPRRNPKSYYLKNYNLPENVIVIDDIDIYQLIMDTDCHMTVFSTCALEAPALGKMNILFNIENKSKEILGDSLTSNKTTIYVNNAKELISFLAEFTLPNVEDVMQEHNNVICNGYKERVDKFINDLKISF